MNTMYFNHFALTDEVVNLSKNAPTDGRELNLSVPDKLRETIRHEAFYCRVPQDQMPSRMVVHGAAIMSLISKGHHVDFECDPEPDDESVGSALAVAKHLPFNFPRREETEKIIHTVEALKEAPDGEFIVRLSPPAPAVLQSWSHENGLSDEVNFTTLAALIGYVGTAERVGLHLSVSPQMMYS